MLNPESTLRDLLALVPETWQNHGDVHFLDYGGKQLRKSTTSTYIEVLELVTPDDGLDYYLVLRDAVSVHDLLACISGNLLDAPLDTLCLTPRAAAAAGYADVKLDDDCAPPLNPHILLHLVDAWVSYYGFRSEPADRVHFRGTAFGAEYADLSPNPGLRMTEAVRRYLSPLGCADLPTKPSDLKLPDDVVQEIYKLGLEGVIDGVHFAWRGDLTCWHVWNGGDEVVSAENEQQAALAILKLSDLKEA